VKSSPRCNAFAQNKLFGGLNLGAGCTVQLEVKDKDGGAVPTVHIRTKRDEKTAVPAYTDKDTIQGEVSRGFPSCHGRRLPGTVSRKKMGFDLKRNAYIIFQTHFQYTLALSLQVKLTPTGTKKLEHHGVKVQLVGEIVMAADKSHPHEFLSLGNEPFFLLLLLFLFYIRTSFSLFLGN
jgi:vacuolar protein sorting-associated protein 26